MKMPTTEQSKLLNAGALGARAHTSVWINFERLSDKLNLRQWLGRQFGEALLDALDLLRDSTEYAFF